MKDIKLDSDTKISSGFQVPNEYFETFSERLMLKLPKKEVKVISFYTQHKNWIYTIAASFILVISIPVINQFNTANKAIENKEIENYLTSRSSISDDEIVNLLNEEDIAKLNINTPIDTKVTEEILSQNPNIEEYIAD